MRRRGIIAMVLAFASPLAAQRAVVVDGRAGSIQVIRIGAPTGAIRVNLSASPGFRILGDTSRAVGDSEVLVSLMIPTSALAGRTRAAVARFVAADAADAAATEVPIEVPIEVVIPRRRALTFAVDDRRLSVLRGDRFELAYSVTNAGNAPDTARLRLALPFGWRGDESQGALVLAPGQAMRRTTRITVSSGSATGASMIRLIALDGADTLASRNALAQVVDPDARPRAAGPTLTIASAAAGSASGGTAGQSVTIEGPIDDHRRVSASAAFIPSASQQFPSFSHLMFANPIPRLELSSDAWRLQLGTAGASLSALAGNIVGGTGLAFDRTAGRWRGGSIIARPGFMTSDGGIAAGEIATTVGSGETITVTASHLTDAAFGGNRLDAIAGDMLYPVAGGTTLSGGLAERRYRDGSGLGWQAELRRDVGTGTIAVRAATTPGGSAAFAPATQQFNAQASQMIGRNFSMAASAWRTRDSSASWRSLDVTGWSFRPALRLGRVANVGLEARQSSFAADGRTGRMGTDELALSATADVRRGAFYASGNLTTASTRREAAVSGVAIDARADRAMAQGIFGIVGVLGRAELTVNGDRSGRDLGIAAREVVYGANVSDIRLLPWSRLLTGRASAKRFDWFGDRPAAYGTNAAIDASLPHAVRIALEASHDPFLATASSASGWVFGIRVETGLSLPRLRTADDGGVVFHDVNGNGVQDRGEPGVGGVVVRRGLETTITKGDGSFELGSPSALPIEIDTRSLPSGLVAPPVAAQGQKRRIGLLTVAAAQVRLALGSGDADRVTATDLTKVAVVARDAGGKAWIARIASPEIRVFDALPPGHYTLAVDASQSAEPLHADVPPTIDVVDARNPPPATITLHTRTLKIRQMSKDAP